MKSLFNLGQKFQGTGQSKSDVMFDVEYEIQRDRNLGLNLQALCFMCLS